MKRVLKNIIKLLLFVTVLSSNIFVIAQSKEDVSFYVELDINMSGNAFYRNGIYFYGSGNYSYKTINGFDDPVFCLDFSNGPYTIGIGSFSKISETKVINVSLYVPTKAFTNAYMINSDFGYWARAHYTAPYYYVYPTFDDLEKIKEYTIETNLIWDDYYNRYKGYDEINWDGMTDPVLTNGKEYPVQDNVFVFVTDAKTGEPIADYYNYSESIRKPLEETNRRINRYTGLYLHKYTPMEKSIVCDIYFISQLPVTKAIPFLGNSCMWQWADYKKANEGIEKVVQSLLLYSVDALEAYQVFDNLSPDKDGVYHLTWEIKDLMGNFFDVAKMAGDPVFLDTNSFQ